MITLDYKQELHPDLPWLQIPERDLAPFTSSSLQYGAGKVAGAYCGLSAIPAQIKGGWMHGWLAEFRFVSPLIAYEDCLANPRKQTTWTATREHERFLEQSGYKGSAIGLPFIYLPEKQYQRRKGSLLVMPAHSLEYTKHDWKFEEYAEAIDQLRHRFESVVICIYPACFKKGYWVENFRKRGYPIIEGAHAQDRNSLERIRALMSQFEFVTTNNFGSCIAYAAAYGAKVSLFGPYPPTKISDLSSDSYYLSRPGLVEKAIAALSETNVKRHLHEFCVSPDVAMIQHEWGRRQLGFENKVSPAEMRRLFGWDFAGRMNRQTRILIQKTKEAGNLKTAKASLKKFLKPEDAKIERELERLAKWPAGKSGTATLQGREIHFQEAAGFMREYDRIFWQLHQDFPCVLGNPLIIDLALDCGMALRFWAEKFPNPRVFILQPETGCSDALEKNREAAKNAEVQFFSSTASLFQALGEDVGEIHYLNLPAWNGTVLAHEFFPAILPKVEHLHFSYKFHPKYGKQSTVLLRHLEETGFDCFTQAEQTYRRPMFQWVEQKPVEQMIDVWAKRSYECG